MGHGRHKCWHGGCVHLNDQLFTADEKAGHFYTCSSVLACASWKSARLPSGMWTVSNARPGHCLWQALAAAEEVVRKQKRELAAGAAASEERLRQSTEKRAADCAQHSTLAAAHRHVVRCHMPRGSADVVVMASLTSVRLACPGNRVRWMALMLSLLGSTESCQGAWTHANGRWLPRSSRRRRRPPGQRSWPSRTIVTSGKLPLCAGPLYSSET